MAKKQVTIEHLDASITRWKSRLRRAMTAIDKLEKQRKRLIAREALAVAPPLAKAVVKPQPASPVAPPPAPVIPVSDDIPAFLRHQSEPSPIADQIRQEQAETKKKKATGRIAKMKAKQSGETKRMPLSGKAALDAIRNG
jgi:hypothetical protein